MSEKKGWLYKLLSWLFSKMPQPAPLPVPEPEPIPEPVPAPQPEPIPTPEPPPTEPTGPRIDHIKSGGKWDAYIYTKGCEDWKIKQGNKATQGELFIKGVFVDAMRPDQMRGAKKELNNAFGVGEHSLNVSKGEVVKVVIKSFDGRKTAPFDWVWPFEST